MSYNEEFYLANNPDVAMAVRKGGFGSGWVHYNATGKTEGRSFDNPYGTTGFNEEYYLANNPDVAKAVELGLVGSGWVHYLANGKAEGRSFSAPADYGTFSEEFYLANNPDVAMAVRAGGFGSGWEHYLLAGQAEGRSFADPYGTTGFDEEFYLANNPDVAKAVEVGAIGSGWVHYLTNGKTEGRSFADPYGSLGITKALTTSTDIFSLTTGNDTVTGAADTFNKNDVVTDSSTTDIDTMTAVITGANPGTSAPTLANIENINLDFKGFGVTFNAAGTSNGTIIASTTQDGNSTATLHNAGSTVKVQAGTGITTLNLESSATDRKSVV